MNLFTQTVTMPLWYLGVQVVMAIWLCDILRKLWR